MNDRASFVTVERRLDRKALPFRLFQKAKRLGIWNPEDIDFSQDRKDWLSFSDLEREVLMHVITLFQEGEEAVTIDLLPLVMTIASEGRLEEEMFLTTFLWEEAKHVDFFDRFLDEVVVDTGNLSRFSSSSYEELFLRRLPQAMNALMIDRSSSAQLRASVTYNMIIEGVLAETGYHGFFNIMDTYGVLPGTRQGILKLREDESRHIAYGIFLLSRLMAQEPKLWDEAQLIMADLLPIAIDVLANIFNSYKELPFGLELNHYTDFAVSQFEKRMRRLEKSSSSSIEEVGEMASEIISENEIS